MSVDHDDELRGALREDLDRLAPTAGFELRVRSRLREHADRRHARGPRVALSVVVSLALVVALVGGFLATRGSGTRSITDDTRVLQDLTSGAAASPVADASSNYVWLTAQGAGHLCTATPWPGASPEGNKPGGPSAPPAWDSPAPSPCTGSPECITTWSLPEPSGDTVCQEPVTEVDVLDWTGALRYHFELPSSVSDLPLVIAAISPDGTRALLSDGTVLNQTGATVGDLPRVGSLLSGGSALVFVGVQWLSDDEGVCIAGPSKVLNGDGSTAGDGAGSGTTLEVVQLDGTTQLAATIATGEISQDPISVDACDTTTDTATITVSGGMPSFTAVTPTAKSTSASASAVVSEPDVPNTVSVWSLKLSTGAVTYHQAPPARPDGNLAGSIGSANGSLAVEDTWNSEVDGCGAIDVVSVPLRGLVPVASPPLTCAEVLALSADGNRFVVSYFKPRSASDTLDLVDASDGTVVRSLQLPANVGVQAVAAPSGADFLFFVDGHAVLVDGSGGASELQPARTGGSNFDLPLCYTVGFTLG